MGRIYWDFPFLARCLYVGWVKFVSQLYVLRFKLFPLSKLLKGVMLNLENAQSGCVSIVHNLSPENLLSNSIFCINICAGFMHGFGRCAEDGFSSILSKFEVKICSRWICKSIRFWQKEYDQSINESMQNFDRCGSLGQPWASCTMQVQLHSKTGNGMSRVSPSQIRLG